MMDCEEDMVCAVDLGVLYVSGTVEEVPNDLVAVVNVDFQNIGRIMCFRKILKTPVRKSIKEVLKVGDTVSLRLRSRSGLHDSNDWFVLEASKETDESELKHKAVKRSPQPETVQSSPGSVPFVKSRPRENRRYVSNWLGVLRIEPKTGTAQIRLEHSFGYSALEVDCPIVYSLIENKTMDCEQLAKIINREVRFDGEFLNSKLIVQKMWFSEMKRCPSDVLLLPQLISEPCLSGLKVPYGGKIVSIPFRDFAIAQVAGIPVLIPLKSLVTRDPIGSFSTMDMFLKMGTTISAKVKRNGGYYIAEKCWLRAKVQHKLLEEEPNVSWLQVWGTQGFLKKGVLEQRGDQLFFKLKTEQAENVIVSPSLEVGQVPAADLQIDQVNVSSNLKAGESSNLKNDLINVSPSLEVGQVPVADLQIDQVNVSSNLKAGENPNLKNDQINVSPQLKVGRAEDLNNKQADVTSYLKVDRQKIFVDGCLATAAQINILVGSEIYYYVRYEKFVACAWSGQPPPPIVVLKNELAVPRGLVDESKYYEAIIDEFVLPSHAMCRIGVLPLLLPMSALKKRRIGTKKGDVVSVCVEEVMVGDVTCLETKTIANRETGSLLVNFTGKVSELPKPVGVIISDDNSVKVHFELCSVKVLKNCKYTNIFSWFKEVEQVLQVGTKVCFTAKCSQVMIGLKKFSDLPQCAVEVCIDDEAI